MRLLRDVADFAAQSGRDSQALAYYQQTLKLEEADLGPNHPDLVPVLSALADLNLKAKRYAEAIAVL